AGGALQRSAHRHAGRSGVGARRRVEAHARVDQVVPSQWRTRRRRVEHEGERLMRDVAIVSFAQSKHVRAQTDSNEVEMLMPVVREALDNVGIGMDRVGFTCSGSTDYLSGQAFSFVMTLDSVGPWPPISESHVAM